ncbi:MAG: metallophosphoesterase family protein [Bacteroidota bacterium]
MKRPAAILLFLFLLVVSTSGHAETRRYRLSWADDPATTISIGFEFTLGRNVYVAYDTEDGGGIPNNYRYKAAPTRTLVAKGMRTVFVKITDLSPGTVYYFMVVDDNSLSRPMSFETSPNRLDKRLSIVAGGDSRERRLARQASNILVSKLRPHAVLFSGDMTTNDSPAEWAAWLDDWQLTMSADGRCYPIIPAQGNHEQSTESISKMFDVPDPRIFYALELGGGLLRAYTLNTKAVAAGDQLVWLKNDLRNHTNVVWKVAQYHHSMLPHTRDKQPRQDLIKYWAPLFYRHGVNLVIESDAHVVKQTWPIRPSREPGSDQGFIRDDLSGTVYIGEGGWGAPIRMNNNDKKWTKASDNFNQLKWIWVSASRMEVRTIKTDQSKGALALSDANRFQVPNGLSLWQPDGKPALILAKGKAREVIRPAAAPPKVHPNQRPNPPTARPGNGGPPGSRIAKPGRPPLKEVLKPNFNNKVKVEYTLRRAGSVRVMVVTDKLIQFYKKDLPAQQPGIYREWIQLPEIPRGVKWELVLKSDKQIVKKYVLSTQAD